MVDTRDSAEDPPEFRAALDADVERFVYVSSSMVFERAEQYPTREDYIDDCPVPLSAYGFSKLTGEVYCRAAHDEQRPGGVLHRRALGRGEVRRGHLRRIGRVSAAPPDWLGAARKAAE